MADTEPSGDEVTEDVTARSQEMVEEPADSSVESPEWPEMSRRVSYEEVPRWHLPAG